MLKLALTSETGNAIRTAAVDRQTGGSDDSRASKDSVSDDCCVRVPCTGGSFFVDKGGNAWWYTENSRNVVVNSEPDAFPTRDPSYLTHVRSIRLFQATDDDMKAISLCRNLKRIDLNDPRVTRDGYREIKNLSSLERCDVRYHYTSTPIDDAGLSYFRDLSNLAWLSLEKTVITDDGLSAIENLRLLKHLCIRSPMINGRGLQHLRGLRKLEYLEVGVPGYWVLQRKHPPVFGPSTVDSFNEALEYVAGLPTLRWLNLCGSPVSDDGLQYLAQVRTLEILSLNWTLVTNDGIMQIANLKNLSSVHLRATYVSETAMKKLRESLPRAWIGDLEPLKKDNFEKD